MPIVIAPAGALLAGLLLLLLVLAFAPKLWEIGANLNENTAPVIGGAIRAIGRALARFAHWIAERARDAIEPVRDFFAGIAHGIEFLVEDGVDTIARVAHRFRVFLDEEWTGFRRWAISTTRNLGQSITRLRRDVVAGLRELRAQLDARIEQTVDWARRAIFQRLWERIEDLRSLVVDHAIPRIRTELDELAERTIRGIERVWDGLKDTAGRIRADLGSIIAGVAATAAGALALAQSIATDVANPLRKCVPNLQRLCGRLPDIWRLLEEFAALSLGFSGAVTLTNTLVDGFDYVEDQLVAFLDN